MSVGMTGALSEVYVECRAQMYCELSLIHKTLQMFEYALKNNVCVEENKENTVNGKMFSNLAVIMSYQSVYMQCWWGLCHNLLITYQQSCFSKNILLLKNADHFLLCMNTIKSSCESII